MAFSEEKKYIIPETEGFDADNIVLSFGAMSDAHYRSDFRNPRFEKAVSLVERFAVSGSRKELDAIISTGDDLDTGAEAELLGYTGDVNEFVLNKGMHYFCCHGGHDYINKEFSSKKFMGALNPRCFEIDTDIEKTVRGYRHSIINGYHFIGIDPACPGGWIYQDEVLSDELIKWLRDDLDAITEAKPDSYIFVMTHDTVYETVRRSPINKKLKAVLDNYYQVIHLSGHNHNLQTDEKTLWQGGFTAVNLASLRYFAEYYYFEETFLSQYITESPFKVNLYDRAQCSLFEVDAKGAVRITRLDIDNEEIVKQLWVLEPVDTQTRRHLEKYKWENRKQAKSGPVFKADSFEVKYSVTDTGKLTFSFGKAADEDMVFGYNISIFEKGSRAAVLNTLSAGGWYIRGDQSRIPEEHIVAIRRKTLDAYKCYSIEISAEDCFGNRSDPYVFDIYGAAGSGFAVAERTVRRKLSCSWKAASDVTAYAGLPKLVPNFRYAEMYSTNGGLHLSNIKGSCDNIDCECLIADNSQKVSVIDLELKMATNWIGFNGAVGISLTGKGGSVEDAGTAFLSGKDGLAVMFKNVDAEDFQNENTKIYPVISTPARIYDFTGMVLEKSVEHTVRLCKEASSYCLYINGIRLDVGLGYLEGYFKDDEAVLSAGIIAGAFYHSEMTLSEINGIPAGTFGSHR